MTHENNGKLPIKLRGCTATEIAAFDKDLELNLFSTKLILTKKRVKV
jgi:hypothetical protein